VEANLKDKIAIDGPVASGKSAVGTLVAHRLDTGIMYRAATWIVLRKGIAPDDAEQVIEALRHTAMDVIPGQPSAGTPTRVVVDCADVTDELRSTEVERAVSPVSGIAEVRRLLIARQREIAEQGPIVMVGRDIGTVVIPDAPLKVFLSASQTTRAERRWRERNDRSEMLDLTTVESEIARRDTLDNMTTPLQPASGAHVVETDGLPLDAVVDRIAALATCQS
jgi:cytidylate kinase